LTGFPKEILLIFIAAVLVDKSGNPPLIIFLFGTIQIYGYAVFAAFPSSTAWLISNYIITGAAYQTIGPIINAWLNSNCGGDKHLRAAATGTITVLG
jgi:ACS family pantothenate transporter-like MFS transporter